MARRVFLHIGLPKSGTTYLQTAMWHNRAALRAQGFLYPGASRMDHYHASRQVRGASAAQLGPEAGVWDRLVDELAAWDGDGLVSHEFFCMATRRRARKAIEALAPAEVQVVVTARDYVRQFPAVWQESLKMNSDLSLDEFMDRVLAHERRGAWSWKSQDLPRLLERWVGAVPAGRVSLVTVPPAGAPRDLLWTRWCSVLGIDGTDFDMDLPFANESLGAPQAAFVHRLKPHLTGPLTDGPVRHRWVRAYLAHDILVPQGGDRFALRPDQAEALTAMSRRAVRRIRHQDVRVVGDLADLVPSGPQPGRRTPDEVPAEEVLEVAARAVDRLVQDVRELTLERDEWRRRARESRPAPALARRLVTRARRLGRTVAGRR